MTKEYKMNMGKYLTDEERNKLVREHMGRYTCMYCGGGVGRDDKKCWTCLAILVKEK